MFVPGHLNFCMNVLLLVFCISMAPQEAEAIDCYECSSKNGSDPNCEDPFHPGHSRFSESCQVGKKNHIGKFPANFCVKITGQSTRSGENLMIRKCVLENMDSQCGLFKFENEELSGCILTCGDDGCNRAKPLFSSAIFLTAAFALICLAHFCRI